MSSYYLQKILLILLSTALLFSCTSPRQSQQLQRGKMYFEASDYREAFNALLPLAAEGNRDAEYALGYLYYYGYGVTQDTATGIFWIKKSAAQGYEPAMLALKSLH